MSKRQLSIILVILLIMAAAVGSIGCSGNTIPPNFTTYTDNERIFSISYPQDWENALAEVANVNQSINDYIRSINASTPVGGTHIVFVAGKPMGAVLNPDVTVVVQPLPAGTWTLDGIVNAEEQGGQPFFSEYHELSRMETTVGGREVAIIENETTLQGITNRGLAMYVPAGKNVWLIGCKTAPEKYSDFENTFHDILLSFRLYE